MRATKNDIVSQVKIIDIARELGIELEPVSSNNFDYRCKCPSPNHKGGNERTASLYINSRKNDFYCYGCLPGDQKILTKDGFVPIKDLKIGDYVLSSDGLYNKIWNKIEKEYNDNIFEIHLSKTHNKIFKFTSEHKMLVLKDLDKKLPYLWKHSKTGKFAFLKRYEKYRSKDLNLEPDVVYPYQIKSNDFLFQPEISKRISIEYLDNIYIKEHYKGPRNKRINKIPINQDTMWLFGYYCAEGSTYRGGIRFTANINEVDFLEKAANIIKNNFQKNTTTKIRKNKNTSTLTCSSTDLEHFFKNSFGNINHNKKAPQVFLSFNNLLQSSFYQGVFDGDGCKKRNVIGLTSEQLILQLRQILINLGIPNSISYQESKIGKDGILRKPVYKIQKLNNFSYNCFFEKVNGVNCMIQKVKLVTEKSFDNTVYDISVKNDNSFSNGSFVVHNCGEHSNVIDFLMLGTGMEFVEAINALRKRVKVSLISEPEQENLIQPNIFSVLLDISFLFRKTILKHPSDLKWINEIMLKTDRYIDDLKKDDVALAKELKRQIEETIKQRYKE